MNRGKDKYMRGFNVSLRRALCGEQRCQRGNFEALEFRKMEVEPRKVQGCAALEAGITGALGPVQEFCSV